MAVFKAKTKKQVSDWVKTELAKNKCEIKKIEEVADTPYSYVLKIETIKKVFYLKKVPKSLFLEVKILTTLSENHAVRAIPKIVSFNDTLSCFITESCGDQSLRNYLSGDGNTELLVKGFEVYKTIQKQTSGKIESFLKLGAEDWRLENLPKLYGALVQDIDLLKFWGINRQDIKALQERKPDFSKLCEKLKSYNIPDTLNNCDFQDNNILIDEKSGELNIIDWGEVNIGNPLLSLQCAFYAMPDRYGFEEGDQSYNALKTAIISGWRIEEAKKDDLFKISKTLAQIYYVLAYKQLMELSDYGFPNSRDTIKNALLVFVRLTE